MLAYYQYTCIIFLLIISIIDIKRWIIPNYLLLIGVIIFGFGSFASIVDWKSGLIGFGIILAFFATFYLLSKGKIGAGDVKLAAICGLLIGFPRIAILMLITGFAVVFISAYFSMKHKNANKMIPFAPILCLSTIVGLLAGDWILGVMAR